MKRSMSPLVAFGLTLGALIPDAASTQDPVSHYQITARVDSGWLHGIAEITLPGTVTVDGAVRLDPRAAGPSQGPPRLRLDRVTNGAGRVLPQTAMADGSLRFAIPSLDSRGPTHLRVEYRMPLDSSDIGGLGYHLFPSHVRGARWYPEALGPDGGTLKFADFDVTLDWPDSFAVLTSGRRLEERVDGQRRRARFRAAHVEGFTLALAQGHERIALERSGLLIEVLAPPDLVESYRAVGERVLDAAAFYRELYGFFPNDRLGILPGPSGYWGGFPMPNVFMIHRGNLTDEFVRFIAAHELAHYYWGLYVLDAGERLGWLMLANGIIADQLYLAHHHGRTIEEQWRARGNGDWIEDYLTAQVAGWEQRLGLDRQEDRALHFDYNGQIRHGKSATGLYLQVRRIGAERFVALQRQLLTEFRHRPLDVPTFVARLEAAGADGAVDFFDRWVRGDASLSYDVLGVERIETDAPAWRVVIQRYGTVGVAVDVEITGAGGETIRRTVPASADRDTLVVSMEGPLQVRLDPEGALPMWNSAHPGIQRLYIHALYSAGLTEPFLRLSERYLQEHQDFAMLRRRISRLEALGRVGELIHHAERMADEGCIDRDACDAALRLVRALRTVEAADTAELLLRRVGPSASAAGLGDAVAALMTRTVR